MLNQIGLPYKPLKSFLRFCNSQWANLWDAQMNNYQRNRLELFARLRQIIKLNIFLIIFLLFILMAK